MTVRGGATLELLDTADATATAGVDNLTTSGELTIPVGATSGTITVPMVGDVLDEPDETFTLTLSAPENAPLVDAEAVGTIADDDEPPPT